MERPTRRRRILVNGDEVSTDRALREAADELGYRIDAKVRVADALVIDRSGLPPTAYRYALQSHFDWVVSDKDSTRAKFGVEFDGASHDSDRARARDALKDGICRDLDFPLLRIDGLMLRPFRRRTVLAVLIDAWALYEAFTAAQESGAIPWDEVFDPHMSLEPSVEDGRLVIDQPYNLMLPATVLLERLHTKGQVRAWRHAMRLSGGSDEALAWAYVPSGLVVVGRATVRSFSFPAFPSFDLADDLAHLDLADRLQRHLEGDASMAVTVDVLAQRVPRALAEFETSFGMSDVEGWSFGVRS